MGKLDGKVVVITAGSSGMALAMAKLFVKEGAYVFITGRDQGRLDDAVKEIGSGVTGVQGDASNLDDLDRLYDTVNQKKGKIDIFFASAGRGSFATLADASQTHFDEIFDLNVRGTFFTVQKALPLFSAGGSIILNGSTAGVQGTAAFSAYSASKAAIRSFARCWLLELKDRNIRVNVLSPGTIDTAILAPIRRGRQGVPEIPNSSGHSRAPGRDCGNYAVPCVRRRKFRKWCGIACRWRSSTDLGCVPPTAVASSIGTPSEDGAFRAKASVLWHLSVSNAAVSSVRALQCRSEGIDRLSRRSTHIFSFI
jgi:NAD(P)-dependent dehydrogenase (short-subunit alcohol dehydrogenase family)